jgi:hypothetical protein
MPDDIALSLNEEAKGAAFIHILHTLRINHHLLRTMYAAQLAIPASELPETLNKISREELAWVFRTLGGYGELHTPGLDQFLRQ